MPMPDFNQRRPFGPWRVLAYPAALLLIVPMLSACAANHRVTDRADHPARNQQLAAELTHRAADLIADDPSQAHRLLRRALDADLYYGPAHNNLGIIHLNQGRLYEAAEEFDWARRLMPGHPDPRINLGIALERGGKIDEALDAYASAVEVYPNHLPAMQALARLQLRSGRYDDGTRKLLSEIRYRGTEEWRAWANARLLVD